MGPDAPPDVPALRRAKGLHDRYLNLQRYYAVDVASTGNQTVCDGRQNLSLPCTEVAMVPRNGAAYTYTPPGETVAVTSVVPHDGFRGSVPDPRNAGPKMLQIGNEGGFLPAPVVRNLPPVPITYDTDPKSMTVDNVDSGTIILGPAKRADIVVDFTQLRRGARLIFYTDAPAAYPAGDPRYDYFTGNPDLTGSGGAVPTVVGKGPNTRTVMQFRVSTAGTGATPPAFNFAALTSAIATAYAASQDKPLIPEPEYNVGTWAGLFPDTPNYATLFKKENSEEHHLVELAVLDAAGRLQIPREYLEEFGIKRRVLVETTADGILIRKPDREHAGVEHGPSSGTPEPAEREPSRILSRWTSLWQRLRSRLGRGGMQ